MNRFAISKPPSLEFIGGPFDGRWRRNHLMVKRLPVDVVCLVTDETNGGLSRPRWMKPSTGEKLSSAALYELDVSSNFAKYRYVGSIGPRSLNDAIASLR